MKVVFVLLILAIVPAICLAEEEGEVHTPFQKPKEIPKLSDSVKIHDAVIDDDAYLVQACVEHGQDINELGRGGQTPLIHAILNDKINVVRWLLQRGANTSIPEENGYTPMHAAAFQGRGEIMKLLLAHGLDPLDRHADGYYPIHRACWGTEPRHTDAVRLLLMSGVPYGQRSGHGQTPLEAVKNNPGTIALLKLWAKEAKAKKAEAKKKSEL